MLRDRQEMVIPADPRICSLVHSPWDGHEPILLIEGVSDAHVAKEIKRRIQEVCRDVDRGGELRACL